MLAQLQSDPDQGYSLRTDLGGGVGRSLVDTNHEVLNLSAGLVYDRKQGTALRQVDNSADCSGSSSQPTGLVVSGASLCSR